MYFFCQGSFIEPNNNTSVRHKKIIYDPSSLSNSDILRRMKNVSTLLYWIFDINTITNALNALNIINPLKLVEFRKVNFRAGLVT